MKYGNTSSNNESDVKCFTTQIRRSKKNKAARFTHHIFGTGGVESKLVALEFLENI